MSLTNFGASVLPYNIATSGGLFAQLLHFRTDRGQITSEKQIECVQNSERKGENDVKEQVRSDHLKIKSVLPAENDEGNVRYIKWTEEILEHWQERIVIHRQPLHFTCIAVWVRARVLRVLTTASLPKGRNIRLVSRILAKLRLIWCQLVESTELDPETRTRLPRLMYSGKCAHAHTTYQITSFAFKI